MTFWQIACGDGTVDLESIFLKLNIALIGPGHLGDYFDHRKQYLALSDGYLIRTFCEEVAIGDIFILKRVINPAAAEWEIKAVGKVTGAYRYEPIFEDVDVSGWAMQHCRRVKWVLPSAKTVVKGGGAPIRIQRCGTDNALVLKAMELLDQVKDT